MRTWRDLAAPDDPSAWYDVDGFLPSGRGTYEPVPVGGTGTGYTATGAADVEYAFYGNIPNPNSVNAEYVIDGSKIWRFDASSVGSEMSDKTGGVAIGNRPAMVQYGLITICVMGSPRGALTGDPTVYASLGSNFAALAGAPQGDCICVESNAVIIANTDTANDAWEASDVGDYTNWSTGEWASGRIYNPAGPITAAVSFNGAVYLFKANSIHRMRYAGGEVKWTVEKVYEGLGCSVTNGAVAGKDGILFVGGTSISNTGSSANNFYWFDGVSRPVLANPETSIGTTSFNGVLIYNSARNLFTVWEDATKIYFFSPESGSWGKSTISYASGVIPLEGDTRSSSRLPRGWAKSAADTLKFYNPSAGTIGAGARYLQTSMVGAADKKTYFDRLTPLLRRRVDLGTDSAALSVSLYRERHDTSAASTVSASESGSRKRFDFAATDNFARFKVTFTDLDVEVDDFLIRGKVAGTD